MFIKLNFINKMDEPFGYNCPYYEHRCSIIHDFCIRCLQCQHCKTETCRCLECDISGHNQSTCLGTPRCFQKEVFCIIPEEFKKYSDIGDSFYGEYSGFGYVKSNIHSKNIFVDENLYENQYIPVKIICKNCFLKMIAEEKEIIEMENEIENMTSEEKIIYQRFLKEENSMQNEDTGNYVTLDQIKFLFER
jgi:hypothetical protein